MERTSPMCPICQLFLQDYLLFGISKELPLSKELRMKSIRNVLPELCDWIYRFSQRVSKQEFDNALKNASCIARRGRKLQDYEYLIHTATFNFLKFHVDWIASEVSYLETLLIESGFVRTKNKVGYHSNAYNYISYIVPRIILCLEDLHDDHLHPKGLNTDLSKLFKSKQKDIDTDTCFDKDDDYQKEILEEDTDDLYT